MENNRRLKTAEKMAVRQRNYQRVRARALVKLAKAHREEYRTLLEKEKENDYTQGKTWIDLDGNTRSSMDTNAGTNRSESESKEADSATRAGEL